MKKKFFTISNLVLSSLITALGFGACKTTKTGIKEGSSANATTEVKEEGNSMPAPSDTINPIRRPDKEVKVLYGPPPTRIKK